MSTSHADPTIFAAHTFLKGELHLTGPTVIGGRVEGAILAEDALEIAPGGVVEGDVQGIVIDIQGTVKGNVVATQACRLGPTARVAGELRAATLAIAEGACFVGQVYVGGVREAAAADDADAPAEAAIAPVNRIESLAHEAEAMAEEAAAAAAPVPTVRVMAQTVQQTLNRSPKIIKAR